MVAQQFTHTDQCQMILIIMPSYTQDLVPDIPEQMDGVEINNHSIKQRFERKNKTPSFKFQLVSKINTPDYCHSLEIYGTHPHQIIYIDLQIIFNKKTFINIFLIFNDQRFEEILIKVYNFNKIKKQISLRFTLFFFILLFEQFFFLSYLQLISKLWTAWC